MDMDFVRCLWMRELVSYGHELKCTFVMARKKVDGVGLNMQAWKYPARFCLVCEFWMTPGRGCLWVLEVLVQR